MIRTNFSWATEPCIVAVIPQLFTIHFFFLLVHGSLADRVPEGLPSDDTYVCLVLAIDAHAIKASPCFLFFFCSHSVIIDFLVVEAQPVICLL